jgi:hypothetical protein
VIPTCVYPPSQPPSYSSGSTAWQKNNAYSDDQQTRSRLASCTGVLPFPGEHNTETSSAALYHGIAAFPPCRSKQPLAALIISLTKCFPPSQSLRILRTPCRLISDPAQRHNSPTMKQGFPVETASAISTPTRSGSRRSERTSGLDQHCHVHHLGAFALGCNDKRNTPDAHQTAGYCTTSTMVPPVKSCVWYPLLDTCKNPPKPIH